MSKISEQPSEPQSRKRALSTDAEEARLDDTAQKKARLSPPVPHVQAQPIEHEEKSEQEESDEESSVLEESSDISDSSLDTVELANLSEDSGLLEPSSSDEDDEDDDEDDEEDQSNDEEEDVSEEDSGGTPPKEEQAAAPSLRTRLHDFFAWIKGSNENLDPNAQSGVEIIPQDDVDEPKEAIRIARVDEGEDEEESDGKPYVEMNVGLGVLEERKDDAKDSEDDSASSEEEDAMTTLLGRKPQKGAVQEVDAE